MVKKIQLERLETKLQRTKKQDTNLYNGKLFLRRSMTEKGSIIKKDKRIRKKCENWEDIEIKNTQNKPLLVKIKKK